MTHSNTVRTASLVAICATVVFFAGAEAAPATQANAAAAEHARIVAYWTPARRAAAIPRDLVMDARGQGYLRKPDGTLIPYGRLIADNSAAVPRKGKPGGDSSPPAVSGFDPSAGSTIGASYTFKATVTDPSGVGSVSFRLQKVGFAAQAFNASSSGGNVWSVSFTGFTDGQWSWWVVARDSAGNTATTPALAFSVSTSGGGGGGGGGTVITNANWGTTSGALQKAAGRIYFEMPSNNRRTRWTGYVCSGTVVNDGASGRSIIITAGHCVYDDSHKAFARNVMFIPDQDRTTSTSGTDRNCSNDPLGCWTTWFGVVDVEYTTRSFPDNSQWDYAHYVVKDTGAHTTGFEFAAEALDAAVTPLSVNYGAPAVSTADASDFTYALGYSYSDDPNLMYCAEDMGTQGSINWWIPSCGLSGGSSGGPWVQGMTVSAGNTTTEGKIISVNSWGYTNQPGMAGPKLNDGASTASCVFAAAKSGSVASNVADGDAGNAVICP